MANTIDNDSPLLYASGTSSMTTAKTLSSATLFWFDEITINADDWDFGVWVHADNQGTPASGDVVNIWLARSMDGTNYPTDEHAQQIGQLDTYSTNTPGEDPAAISLPIPLNGAQKVKIGFAAPQAGTRNINVKGVYNSHRSS